MIVETIGPEPQSLTWISLYKSLAPFSSIIFTRGFSCPPACPSREDTEPMQREDHPPSVLQNMTAIMELILEEMGDISQALLDVILHNLLKDRRNVSPAARKLAISLVQHCAEKTAALCSMIFNFSYV